MGAGRAGAVCVFEGEVVETVLDIGDLYAYKVESVGGIERPRFWERHEPWYESWINRLAFTYRQSDLGI